MSDNEKKTAVGGGITFLDLLAIVFIVLKLCGVISWPWIWVLAPIWIPLALALILLTFFMICIIKTQNLKFK